MPAINETRQQMSSRGKPENGMDESACSDLPAFVLPKAEVLPSFWCPKPTHEVWINQGLICGTDKDYCQRIDQNVPDQEREHKTL